MKKTIIIFLSLVVMTVLVFYNLPTEISNRTEIKLGNELIKNIERYISVTGEIPRSNDWETLETIGFTKDEMERAYPEIQKLNDSTFELIFTVGFDPPYLLWNSDKQIWKEDFPSIPEDWKK